MAGPSSVSFLSPQDAVQQQISMQEAQRQQDLADALRQRSLTPIQVQSGSSSWTQGLAQLAQAVAANHLNRAAKAATYSGTINAANASARALGAPGDVYDTSQNPYSTSEHGRNLIQRLGDFVSGGPPVNRQMPPAPGGQGGLPNASAMPPMAAPMPPAVAAQSGIVPTPNNAPVNQGAGPTPTVGQPAPSQTGDASSPAPASSGNSQPVNPLALTGDWQSNYMLANRDPAEYNKALIAKASPNAMENTLAHAQAALARGDTATAITLLQSVHKENYIAPITARAGNAVLDPNDPNHVLNMVPQSIPGGNPEIVNGRFTGNYVAAGGAADITQSQAEAKAKGEAAGQLVETVNPVTGQREYQQKTTLLGGGAGGRGAGSLQSTYGTPPPSNGAPANNVSSLSPAEIAAGTARGTASAARFDGYTQAAQGSQERQTQLGNIIRLTGSNSFGPGSEGMANVAGYINTALRGTLGHDAIDPKSANATAEFTKYATQLAASQSAAMGLGGTDSKFAAIMAAVPNPHLQNGAAREMARYFLDNEAAIQAKANASTTFAKQRGSENSDQFEQSWRNSYDRSNPIDTRILSAVHHGAPVFQALVKALPPNEANYAIERYKNLRRMGAF